MPDRFDISEKLIHFTNGGSQSDAFARLAAIIRERRLMGGTRMIKGSYRCVCFTEAPPAAFASEFVNQFPFARYSQFGLMFDKAWIYERGGRPVIYQSDGEFDVLPEELRWRHVRFEPVGDQIVDFTWEREWRVRCDALKFTPGAAIIVVPNGQWADALRRDHDVDQDTVVEMYAAAMGGDEAEMWREPFRWRIATLG
jgi:hypothetical protein